MLVSLPALLLAGVALGHHPVPVVLGVGPQKYGDGGALQRLVGGLVGDEPAAGGHHGAQSLAGQLLDLFVGGREHGISFRGFNLVPLQDLEIHAKRGQRCTKLVTSVPNKAHLLGAR